MRTFTKLCLLALALTFSATLFAQQSISSYVGNKAPDKMELIRQLHGSSVIVPLSPEGSTKDDGDNCLDPIEIPSLPYFDENQTTVDRGNSYDETCLNDFDGGEDIIYQLELASAATIQVTIDPKGTPRTGVALNDDCSFSSLCLAMSYDLYNNGAVPHGFTVTLEPGTYYIMVDTWPNPTSIADFDLLIEEVATVANDFCEDAIAIGEVINLEFSTTLATNTPGSYTNSPEIWYNYTAGFTGQVAVDLCGSDYDTYLVVWEGTDCPPVQYLYESDDFCGINGLQSKLVFNVIENTIYKIEIGGWDGANGDGLLSIYQYEDCELTCPPGGIPENELCGTSINGGCNMDIPVFTFITSSGTTICGNLWSDFGTRDTDWFRVVLDSPGNIKMSVTTEESVVFGLVGQIVPGVAGCDNVTSHLTVFEILPACNEDFIQVYDMPKGTYYFFVAPMDYFAHACPGFSYQASFEYVELANGFIKGNVFGTDIAAGIEGVVVSAGNASTITNNLGNYILEVPVGFYTVEANGYPAGYETKSELNVEVTDGDFTTVDFILEPLPAPVLLTATPDVELVELTWSAIGAKAEGSKTLMGDIFSKNDYEPGVTMNLDFTLTIYSPDFEWGVYAEMEFPVEFSLISVGSLNGVPGVIAGQKVSWSGLFYETSVPEEIDFYVEVEVVDGTVGPLVVPYYVEGDGFGLDPHYFNGNVTIYQDGGAYVPTFNVYRRKVIPGTPTYFIPIAYGVIGNSYLDEIFPGGGEWCYLVKQVLADKTESAASNILCASPGIRPGSDCEYAIDYGQVNDPAISESLIQPGSVRWFMFEVTHAMDIAVTLDNVDFNAALALYADCEGTFVFENDDFCGAAGYDTEQIYKSVPAGTYYAKVSGVIGATGSFDIFITQVQLLTIREGWSGFSTYMNPAGNLNIASQLDCIKEDMIITIRQNPYGIWWPSQNVNSIGSIYNTYGYKSKMDEERTTVIFGSETPNKTVALPAGSSYLPVRVTTPTSTSEIETQLAGKLLIVYDIYNPAAVIWPDGGLNTLAFLVPDHAYLINMFVPASFTYPPAAKNAAPNAIAPPSFVKASVWNEVSNTGTPHFISISKDALTALEIGDIIGVFDANNLCVGIVAYDENNSNLFLPAFGNDETTELKDGLNEGELMTFKLFRESNSAQYDLDVTFAEQMANSDGLFQSQGMSMIVEFKVGSTSIQDVQLANVSIYPNPTTGIVNISGIENKVEVVLTNVQGQEVSRTIVSSNTTIDLSNQSKGVYFIRLMSDNSTRIEKIILK